MIGHNFSQAAQ